MEKEAVVSKNPVEDYEAKKIGLFKYFKCEEDYFIKFMQDLKWSIKSEGDFYFLNYWERERGKLNSAVVRNIVRKGGNPLIYKTDEYNCLGFDNIRDEHTSNKKCGYLI